MKLFVFAYGYEVSKSPELLLCVFAKDKTEAEKLAGEKVKGYEDPGLVLMGHREQIGPMVFTTADEL